MEEQSKRHREERERRQEMLRKKPELQLQMILNGRRYECFSDWWKSECHDGKAQTIRAYREEAHALREFLRTCTQI